MRYFIEFAYDGTHYFGFQIQPKQISVQEVLERNLSCLLRKKIKIVGAARTDTGVHARKMFGHFDYEYKLPENLIRKINAFLPKDIVIYSLFKVSKTAHARFDATFRTYSYYFSTIRNPFEVLFSFPAHHFNLQIPLMQEAASYLLQVNDFKSFSKLHSNNKNTLCKVIEAKFAFKQTTLIFTITANRFLRNMVRAIVGTLLRVGIGKLSIEQFKYIVDQQNRLLAGTSAPAHALFLENIKYPDWVFLVDFVL